eukprot:TRINITY_DN3320_c0_g1_i5.p1 TRINITY_DN3320_c0_g1~~TRINITY_DN3320_c0_g1_i5.p1  ORF type:complete len:238 (+),score=46.26 TRINITY_DN3320_c0_g1_i5:166-879(+)
MCIRDRCWAPAPELLGDAPMRPGVAADVFALGCLHFYLVTGGAHLYGKRSVRVNRIMAGKPGLPGLLAKVSTHADFVDKAVSHDPSNRATAGGLQEHPALWTSSKAADFVCDLSDQLDSTEACELHLEIDKVGKAVCGKDWSKRLDPWMREDLFARRGYRVNALQDLMRAVRNKIRHCLTLPAQSQGVIHASPEGVVEYFLTKFPRLIVEVYGVMSSRPSSTECLTPAPFEEMPPHS